jgi:hypothetical protein
MNNQKLLLSLLIVFFAVMAPLSFILRSDIPQSTFDLWTLAHFTAGFGFAYLLSYKLSKPIYALLGSLGLQLGWKFYEYTTGYNVFMASLGNCELDLAVGVVGAILATWLISPK